MVKAPHHIPHQLSHLSVDRNIQSHKPRIIHNLPKYFIGKIKEAWTKFNTMNTFKILYSHSLFPLNQRVKLVLLFPLVASHQHSNVSSAPNSNPNPIISGDTESFSLSRNGRSLPINATDGLLRLFHIPYLLQTSPQQIDIDQYLHVYIRPFQMTFQVRE